MELELCAPCLFGLEGIVAAEYRRLGFANVRAENGRVYFTGDYETVVRANLWSRYSERILIKLAEFPAGSFEELFEGVKAIAWENHIPKEGQFPVKGHCVHSRLASVPNCQKIIKKAVVNRLQEQYHVNWLNETKEKYQIQFTILKDLVSIYLDTTGVALHKRGYRQQANAAPIRETLAAAMVDLSRWKGQEAFCDPFCGSGTILIEAAMKAANYAPGCKRHFQCETWSAISGKVWHRCREEAIAAIRPFAGELFGCDIDAACVELTKDHARKVGLSEKIRVQQGSAMQFPWETFEGTVVTNPPYGERLEDVKTAQELYHAFGQVVRGNLYVISSQDTFEQAFGRKADKKRKLYNGMLQCNLYMYFR